MMDWTKQALSDVRLGLRARLVCVVLADLVPENGSSYLKQTVVADALAVPRESVNRDVRQLVELGYLEQSRAHGERRHYRRRLPQSGTSTNETVTKRHYSRSKVTPRHSFVA